MVAEQRCRALQESMREENLAAIITVTPENILSLTGFWPSYWVSASILLSEGHPIVITGESEADFVPTEFCGELVLYDFERPESFFQSLLRVLKQEGAVDARLGIELTMKTVAGSHVGGEVFVPGEWIFERFRTILPRARWADVSPLLAKARAVKDETEILKIRHCYEIGIAALREAKSELRPGCKEIELAASVESYFQTRAIGGHHTARARAYAFVMSGPRSGGRCAWGPYNFSTSRAICPGDLVLVELDAVLDGYWIDLTRTWVCGDWSDKQRKLYATVSSIQSEMASRIKPGLSVSVVDSIFRNILKDAGLDRFCPHGVGHGVGFAFHEEPYLDPQKEPETKILSGMVLALEPAAYIDGWGGVRLEDEYVVGMDGCNLLIKEQ